MKDIETCPDTSMIASEGRCRISLRMVAADRLAVRAYRIFSGSRSIYEQVENRARSANCLEFSEEGANGTRRRCVNSGREPFALPE